MGRVWRGPRGRIETVSASHKQKERRLRRLRGADSNAAIAMTAVSCQAVQRIVAHGIADL